uniref:Protoporphyrinogen oxidase n=1 Tax=Panstrongylus megistus TaxID=65343 RepID=A0A069DTX3_9HEMI
MTLILGGGIGGLSAAHYLIKAGTKNITLLESTNRVGGWIQSIKDPKTGIIFEKGPRTLRIRGNIGMNTLSLIEELGLEHKIKPITIDHPSSKNRFIFVNNRLHILPTSFSALFKKTPPFSTRLFKGIWRDLTSPAKKSNDDSVYAFIERRFGVEVADYLVSSMICGICAGDAKEISVKFFIPNLFEAEQKYGSVVKGYIKEIMQKKKAEDGKSSNPLGSVHKKAKLEKWSVFGMDGGMVTLVDAVKEDIVAKGTDIKCNSQVTNLSIQPGSVKCCVNEKEFFEYKHLISSLSAINLSPLLKEEHPILADELSKIPFVTVAVVNLAFKGQLLDREAFGFLVPPSQGLPILGVIFDSCNFPQENHTVLTVMMGGKWFNKFFGDNPTDKRLLNIAVGHCRDILGITQNPICHHTAVRENCIPQYVVGHYDRIDRIFSYIKEKQLPLSLIGSSYSGIGVHDVILSAKRAAQQVATIK